MRKIKNPVLRGFHPDPSIVRVGDDFYIATSTFEWFPGVCIYHSRDLVNWNLVARPLDSVKKLPLAGIRASGGVWAPCLSHDGKKFYLIYSIVRTWAGRGRSVEDPKDVDNFLITSKKIDGKWSNPVYLNSSGFDPSLFHDDDGRKWLVNMEWDDRPGRNHFSGILLQEYDPRKKMLVGNIKKIYTGTDIGLTEGPHIYKRNGWYYLLVAEGGTSYAHAVTLARSRNLEGPYETHPANPILTSVSDREAFNRAIEKGEDFLSYVVPGLQKAGHASIAPLTNNKWIMAHLCGRPLKDTPYCPLGRETALQLCEWRDDDWLYVLDDNHPRQEIVLDLPPVDKKEDREFFDSFENSTLDKVYQFPRIPLDKYVSLKDRPGFLRLYGRESIVSEFEQVLVARRVQAFSWMAETCIEFEPENHQQRAGLVVKYDEANQYYLRITREDDGNIVLAVVAYDHGASSVLPSSEIVLSSSRVYLRAEMNYKDIYFSYSEDGLKWQRIEHSFESWKLSDDYVEPMGFTGMFVGMACQDLTGRKRYADFEYFLYRELE
ncbi:glycoside hydrolase family 43 protein [Spirochaetia bacterium 38H-sp]|uniref:Glycoside hydrolase family 43 protein n=1 Tax=Rarispira pelagica TaxID=3141764 RepID=A0ABU9UBQ9_9SPIR